MQKKDWEKLTPGKSYIGGQNGLEMGIQAKTDKKMAYMACMPISRPF